MPRSVLFFEPSRVDEIFEKQDVFLGPWHGQPRFGEQHARLVHAVLAIVLRQIVERLGTLRASIVSGEGLADKPTLVIHIPQAARLHHAGIPRLLLPASHCRPFGVSLGALGRAPGILVGLCEIEPIAVIVGLGFERLGQQPYVALELVDPVGAARVVLVPDPAQFPDISGHIDIFVGVTPL